MACGSGAWNKEEPKTVPVKTQTWKTKGLAASVTGQRIRNWNLRRELVQLGKTVKKDSGKQLKQKQNQ